MVARRQPEYGPVVLLNFISGTGYCSLHDNVSAAILQSMRSSVLLL